MVARITLVQRQTNQLVLWLCVVLVGVDVEPARSGAVRCACKLNLQELQGINGRTFRYLFSFGHTRSKKLPLPTETCLRVSF